METNNLLYDSLYDFYSYYDYMIHDNIFYYCTIHINLWPKSILHFELMQHCKDMRCPRFVVEWCDHRTMFRYIKINDADWIRKLHGLQKCSNNTTDIL